MWFVADIPIPDTVHGLVVSLFVFTSLAFVAVGMRVYTRVRLIKMMGVDDYLIVVAMVGRGNQTGLQPKPPRTPS